MQSGIRGGGGQTIPLPTQPVRPNQHQPAPLRPVYPLPPKKKGLTPPPPKAMTPARGAVPIWGHCPWHHERAPHLSQFLNLPPSPPTPWMDNPPPSTRGDSLLKRQTRTYTRRYVHPPAALMAHTPTHSQPRPAVPPSPQLQDMDEDVDLQPRTLFAQGHGRASTEHT